MDKKGKMRSRLYVRVRRPEDRRALLAWVATARHRIPGELLQAVGDYAGYLTLRAAVLADRTVDAQLRVDAAVFKKGFIYDKSEGYVATPHCTFVFDFDFELDDTIAVWMMVPPGSAPGGFIEPGFASATEFRIRQNDETTCASHSDWAGHRDRYSFLVTALPREGRCDLSLRARLRPAKPIFAGAALPQKHAVSLDPTRPDEMWGLVATEAGWDLPACGWLQTR